MKTNKAQGVLFMMETLFRQGYLDKQETMEALAIPELTFRRYISEIRCYFVNFEREEEIIYDKANNRYLYKKS